MYQLKVPATSANLGPGFDCMGLVLKLYNNITVEENDELVIRLVGDYTSNIPTTKDNLLWKSACLLWDKLGYKSHPLKITLDSYVPPARGLGSSSTAVVGGLMIANAIVGFPLDRFELLKLANEIEGHPDNVTPALYSGVTLTVISENNIVPRILAKQPKFKTVVVIPNILVNTENARSIQIGRAHV